MPVRLGYLVAAVCLASCWGCACGNYCAPETHEPACEIEVFECRPAEPQPLVPDVSQLDHLPPPTTPSYCALAEQDVQCQAGYHSLIGNLLDAESSQACVESGHGARGSDPTLSSVLSLASVHQRNEDAAAAMELFLRLVAAEASARSLAGSLTEFDRTIDEIHRWQTQGLIPPVSLLEVEQQQGDVQYRQAQLQLTITQLNNQLANMLNITLPPQTRFWPECDLTVTPDVPSGEEAVMLALAMRADLAAARLAWQTCGEDNRAAAEWVLRQVSAGLGTSTSHVGLLLPRCLFSSADVSARCDQLALLVSQRERTVRQETLQAVEAVALRLIQIDLRRKKLDFARQRLQSLQQQQELTAGVSFQLGKARLDIIAVEQELLQEVIEWKVAVVQLKRAQGLLAAECR